MASSFARSWIRKAAPAIGAGVAAVWTLCAAAGDANAYEVKRTSKGELVHWESDSVFYSVDPSVNLNVDGALDATLTAMNSWSGSVGAPELRAKVSDATSPTRPGFDEKNGIFFIAGGYAPAGRALAITVLTYDNTTGRILDSDIIFNGKYTFKVLSEAHARELTLQSANTDTITHEEEIPEPQTVYDLHHVIAHEVGHSLGMNDEMAKRETLMYRFTAPNDASMRAPTDDDISGLAELYSARLEGRGNGCGGATVAAKKPSLAAQHAAVIAALGLLLFLVLRAKSDRRARLGFVLATAAAAVALMPSVSEKGGQAQATELSPGHARAKVLSTRTALESGLMKTTFELATTVCRAASCPKKGHGEAWGGTIGNVTQEVGGHHAPKDGEDVDVSFSKLPNLLARVSSPLGVRDTAENESEIRVLTQVR